MSDWRSARFGRAAGTYHASTPVQVAMAAHLASLVPGSAAPDSILELGCGTGHLTRELLGRFPSASVLATDLSEAMLQQAASRWDRDRAPEWAILDGFQPKMPGRTFSLVASNALVQWFPDLAEHFARCLGLCAPGGHLLVSGFARDNFPELERILAGEPFGYPPGPGHAPETVVEAVARSGWVAVSLSCQDWPVLYPAARAFLSHPRDSGANRPPPPGRSLGRSGLQTLLQRLQEDAGGPDGVRITWKPWFLLARPAGSDGVDG
jgi:malonyl-CoA O-methyltransferase